MAVAVEPAYLGGSVRRPLPALTAAALATALAAGCASTTPPRRFAGALTGGVSLDDLGPWPAAAAPTPAGELPAADGPRVATVSGNRTPGADRTDGAAAGGVARDELVTEDQSRAISRLSAPHLQPKVKDGVAALDVAGAGGVEGLRALVGHRDGRGDVAFALAAAAVLAGAPADADRELRAVADGPALVALATHRGAARARTRAPLVGDLLVFDRARDGAAASLVAVALGTDARGVTEILYLARGVVRRGFVDAARPSVARDDDGRVHNTYVRHGKDYPPKGTRYLAGELLAHVIAWPQLR